MQGVSKTNFENYVKANDAILRNMQNQGQGLQNQMTNLTEMLSKFVNSNTASSSSSGSLPSNTVTNPKEDLKGRPFLSTAKALIDLYEEKLTLRVGSDELMSHLVGCTTNHSDALPPSSSPVKTSDNLEEFVDELTLLKKIIHEENFQVYSNPLFKFNDNFTSSNENPLFNKMDEDVVNENSNISDSDELVLLNTPLSDKIECFAPEDDIDEIDAFLAMEVSSNFEEGYFDSEGDVIFLENLLSDDTTHNLAPEAIFSSIAKKQNESIHNTSITFSSRSDPLHHEFAGELLTLPSRNDHKFGEYLSLMTVLCKILTSRS
ncbi:hypothetical protein Tco_1336410 [Tanacetum coccineum]